MPYRFRFWNPDLISNVFWVLWEYEVNVCFMQLTVSQNGNCSFFAVLIRKEKSEKMHVLGGI